jgi:hypothetical protein
MLNVKINGMNGNWVDINTEYSMDYVEFSNGELAKYFAKQVNDWMVEPRFKKECYYIKTRGENKLVYGYKVEGIPFAVRKINGYWYVDHYYSGLAVSTCGSNTRTQAIQGILHAYGRIINENIQRERIN